MSPLSAIFILPLVTIYMYPLTGFASSPLDLRWLGRDLSSITSTDFGHSQAICPNSGPETVEVQVRPEVQEVEEILSKERFMNYVERRWKYNCIESQELSDKAPYEEIMRREFPALIYEALEKIAKLNPSLVLQTFRTMRNSDLIFECNTDEVSLRAAANYANGKIRLGTVTSLLNTMDSQQREQQRELLGERFDEIRDTGRMFVFHEFLHHLGFNNFSPHEHNNLALRSGERQYDVTFACTAQALGNSSNPIFAESLRFYANTSAACRTCATAEFAGRGRVRVTNDSAKLEAARRICPQ